MIQQRILFIRLSAQSARGYLFHLFFPALFLASLSFFCCTGEGTRGDMAAAEVTEHEPSVGQMDQREERKDAGERKGSGVLVELFTSEGCSSCPPAEAYLNDLVERAKRDSLPIYPVAFHVDYWDRLGWKDRFSDRRWSDRQRAYAEHFRNSSIYTPQMVLNGSTEFVGSDRGKGNLQIDRLLKMETGIDLELESHLDTNGALHYGCRLSSQPEKSDLVLMVVEQNLTTDVSRGENSGRQLHHENVVRLLQRVPVTSLQLEGTIPLPDSLKEGRLALIGVVQERDGMSVLGVTGEAIEQTVR